MGSHQLTTHHLAGQQSTTTTSKPQPVAATAGNQRNTLLLVGGLEHFLFSHLLGRIIPIDFHIFQRGGPTTNQIAMFAVEESMGDRETGHVPRTQRTEVLVAEAMANSMTQKIVKNPVLAMQVKQGREATTCGCC